MHICYFMKRLINKELMTNNKKMLRTSHFMTWKRKRSFKIKRMKNKMLYKMMSIYKILSNNREIVKM